MKPGAKWCISMQTSDYHWNEYSSDFHFFFWFRNKASLKNNRKIAISVFKKTWKVALLYNGVDNRIRTPLPSYIIEAINNKKEGYKEKELNRLKSMFTLNPQTNRYDYDGDLDWNTLSNFVSENKNGFTINFGKITGNFSCYNLGLTSLKGAPIEVGGWFDSSWNKLTSLKGAPQEVGESFICPYNQLTSLKGAPQKIGWSFDCFKNQLTSLEGVPKEIEGNFDCSNNKLTSLEGAPQIVGRGFYCYDNQLTSLEGAPKEVGWCFSCNNNQLTSLKGAPQTVGENFSCPNNKLTSLEGAPQTVGGNFSCSINQLTSLKGAPQTVGGDFYCRNNPNLHSLDGIGKVRGFIFKDF